MGDGSSFFRFTPPASQAFRSRCDACGGSNLVWGTLTQIAAQLDVQGQLRAMEALDYFGPGSDAWRCSNCDNFGVFSDWESGF